MLLQKDSMRDSSCDGNVIYLDYINVSKLYQEVTTEETGYRVHRISISNNLQVKIQSSLSLFFTII